ncbi:MAG TPA: hypothetical protein VMZ28_07510 [Kofleriaceae bacterium]|nr:hypothetical protein [Kofleriaceae bacterium]
MMTRAPSCGVLVLLLLACQKAPAPAPAPAVRDLTRVEVEGTVIWVAGGASEIDTDDPCCGLTYTGNTYEDAIATCAPPAEAGAEDCGADRSAVYPGLADDRVCGERRRCVPRARARLLVADATPVEAEDHDGHPLPRGAAADAAPLVLDRSNLVAVTTGAGATARRELVAVDHGAAYTIHIAHGAITRVAVTP